MNRQAQVWYLDMFIGVSIILIVAAVYMSALFNTVEMPTTVTQDAQSIAGLLMSPGYPAEWNASDVVVAGIVDDYRLNSTKANELYALTHSQMTALFQSTNNIYIYVEQEGSRVLFNGINESGNALSVASKQVAHVERFVLHNGKPASLHVVVWSA